LKFIDPETLEINSVVCCTQSGVLNGLIIKMSKTYPRYLSYIFGRINDLYDIKCVKRNAGHA